MCACRYVYVNVDCIIEVLPITTGKVKVKVKDKDKGKGKDTRLRVRMRVREEGMLSTWKLASQTNTYRHRIR